jgi:hypothetical protein
MLTMVPSTPEVTTQTPSVVNPGLRTDVDQPSTLTVETPVQVRKRVSRSADRTAAQIASAPLPPARKQRLHSLARSRGVTQAMVSMGSPLAGSTPHRRSELMKTQVSGRAG